MGGSKTQWAIAGMCFALALTLALTLAVAPDAGAQKKKKNNKDEVKELKDSPESVIVLPDPQAIETKISEMLAAWQIGDLTMMQKYYAPEVTVVSGAFEPPLQGWANYAQAYQRQRERMQSVRLDRQNTYVQVKGTVAWAVYQWEMTAIADGKPFGARGHTTLTLEKRGANWLIVHNHTSIVQTAQPQQQAQPQPGQNPPPSGNKPQ